MEISISQYQQDSHRDVNISLCDDDVISADSTLAYVIVPVLSALKASGHTRAHVDKQDVPCDMHGNIDDHWNWVLDEMIWAFTQINLDWEMQFDDNDGIHSKRAQHHRLRMKNGFRLFGRYFEDLWS